MGVASPSVLAPGWIQTFTGLFWPLNPQHDHVRLDDIAHALSLINRFNGHAREPYSIAQHSVLVSKLVERMGGEPMLQMVALHEASDKAYLGDGYTVVDRCLWLSPPDGSRKTYFQIRGAVHTAICHAFGITEYRRLSEGALAVLALAKSILLHSEARDLIPPIQPWFNRPPELLAEIIEPADWKQAKVDFIFRHHELMVRLKK